MVELTETTVAMAFAALGVLFSIAWLALGLYGVRSLADIRDSLRDQEPNGG